jgi:hypothetical protein
MNNPRLTYASVGIGVAIAVLYFRVFFRDGSQFKDDAENAAKGYWMRHSFLSPLRWIYDGTEIQWSEMKIIIWIGLSVGCGILAYHELPEWFPTYFPR